MHQAVAQTSCRTTYAGDPVARAVIRLTLRDQLERSTAMKRVEAETVADELFRALRRRGVAPALRILAREAETANA